MLDLVVFTAATKGFDLPRADFHDECPHIAFVEQEYVDRCNGYDRGWVLRRLPRFSQFLYPERRDSRAPKILSHLFLPEFETSIWIDTTVQLKVSPWQVHEDLRPKTDLALVAHPERKTAEQEANAATYHESRDPARIKQMLEHYRQAGFNGDVRLTANHFIYRRHTVEVCDLNMAWWEQYCCFSSRDQISLPYVCWQLDKEIHLVPGAPSQKWGDPNPYYTWKPGRWWAPPKERDLRPRAMTQTEEWRRGLR